MCSARMSPSGRLAVQAVCVVFVSLLGASLAVKNITMTLPEAVAQGDTVTLRCDYDLEQQNLYSIKWFRDESEFYQFVPKEIPASKVFDVDGVKIKVDVSRSDAYRVTLQDVGRQPPAYYRCEVSADAPTFHTGLQTGLLTVIVPPQRPPAITVDKRRFNTGDLIRANCTVGPSYPVANITWLLDDIPLSNLVEYYAESVSHEPAQAGEEDRLESVRSAVQLTGHQSKMSLSCRASMFNVYQQSSAKVELQSEGAPKPAPVRKAANSAANSDALRAVPSAMSLAAWILVPLLLPLLQR